MLLIGLTGRAFAGKDTVADHLKRHHGFFKMAFADPLREGLKTLFGLGDWNFSPEGKEEDIPWIGQSPRQLMQSLGTEWGRDRVHPEIWCRHMDLRVRARARTGHGLLVIPDIRFVEEARFVHSRGGKIWRVVRPDAPTTVHADHSSEQEQNRIEEEVTLLNDGTLEQLFEQADELLDQAMEEQAMEEMMMNTFQRNFS